VKEQNIVTIEDLGQEKGEGGRGGIRRKAKPKIVWKRMFVAEVGPSSYREKGALSNARDSHEGI